MKKREVTGHVADTVWYKWVNVSYKLVGTGQVYGSGLFVCLFFFFLNACSCTKDVLGAYGGQKRALDSQELEVMDVCELPYWCWELNQCSL